MRKPKAKIVKRLDYHECAEYISEKLGYNLRDTLGKFSKTSREDGSWETTEYRDFWHFLVERCDISNGCEIYMPDVDSAKKDWQKPIIEAFLEEFGHGPYWVGW